MKKDQHTATTSKTPAKSGKSSDKSKSPETEFPLSEKDEVKQAEERMRKRSEKR